MGLAKPYSRADARVRRLRPLLQSVLDRTAGSPYFTRKSTGLDTASLVAEGLVLLAGGTLSRKELARLLAERHPGRNGRLLPGQVDLRTPLVHGVATGAWGSWGNRSAVSVTPAEVWLGQPMATATATAAKDSAKELIRRYLAAFGPAGVKDGPGLVRTDRLGGVVTEMHAELRRYFGPDGRDLIDLADAELPDPETLAPVRLLPAFDNALLGHADRTRVFSELVEAEGVRRRAGRATPSPGWRST
ncbi:DNA glycosylase AlkZ-like family protein [Streptomyces sp. NPDC056637]|uniref:DNA glycosylase AlkZ-like family protein n=1 Tax=Streptomyces sp. NPDC056637 TaxID=3345886 RepID=UPI003679FD1B